MTIFTVTQKIHGYDQKTTNVTNSKVRNQKELVMTDREKEIMEAIFTMGLVRLDPETYPQEEVDALIYRALHLLETKEGK